MLEVKNLKKRFGDFEAVKGISFTVPKGEVLGVLGPNGAGKSTTMRMITGFLPPTSGTAVICGHDIGSDPVGAKGCIGYLPESAPSYRGMIVEEYLKFIAEIRGFHGKVAKEKVEAQAIIHDPKVLIMDEPTDGLDPNQKHTVREMIKEMSAEKAIVISTHILEEVDAVCTRAVIIADGEIKADGTPAKLKAMDASGRLDVVFRNLTNGGEK